MSKRELFITREITKEDVPIFQNTLKEFEAENPSEPIKIYIDCYGGSLSALFSILDMIENCKCPIYTVDVGEADSAAAVILAAGTKRFINKNSRVMLHEVQISMLISQQPASAVQAMMKEVEILNDRFFNELSRLTKKTRQELEKDIAGKDLFLSAEEAIEYGIVDEIVTPEVMEKYQLVKESMNSKPINSHKENKTMTKEEMFTALKKDFNVDVENLQVELSNAKQKATTLEKVNAEQKALLDEANSKLANIEADLENKKKNEIITKAISEMKIYPAEKDVYLANFKTAEDLEKFVGQLTPKLNKVPQGKKGADDNGSEFDEATQRAIDKGAITAEDAKKYITKEEE